MSDQNKRILKASLISYSDKLWIIRNETCKDIAIKASKMNMMIKTKPYEKDDVHPLIIGN